MSHLYLTALAAVVAANGIAMLVAVALATTRKRWFNLDAGRTTLWSQLFLLVGSILPHWRTSRLLKKGVAAPLDE